jgi:hypothetical protein
MRLADGPRRACAAHNRLATACNRIGEATACNRIGAVQKPKRRQLETLCGEGPGPPPESRPATAKPHPTDPQRARLPALPPRALVARTDRAHPPVTVRSRAASSTSGPHRPSPKGLAWHAASSRPGRLQVDQQPVDCFRGNRPRAMTAAGRGKPTQSAPQVPSLAARRRPAGRPAAGRRHRHAALLPCAVRILGPAPAGLGLPWEWRTVS